MGQAVKWSIRQSILCLQSTDGSITIPAARDIYNAVYKNAFTFTEVKVETTPCSDYPDLVFSRIPVDLQLIIDSYLDEDSFNIRAYILALIKTPK